MDLKGTESTDYCNLYIKFPPKIKTFISTVHCKSLNWIN